MWDSDDFEVEEFDDFSVPKRAYEFDQETATLTPVVSGQLRMHIEFWKSIGTSNLILSIIEHGYFLPFIEEPSPVFMRNHASTVMHHEFVESAILELLNAGSVKEVSAQDLTICHPLGVVPKKNNKLRLILDLRYLNKHLSVTKFKYEDLFVVSQLVSKGDWFVTFDLKNGYHHEDIACEHQRFLGFCFPIKGCMRYFVFASLPFGLVTTPFIFTKLLRPLIKHWRAQGKHTLIYLDDGFGSAFTYNAASALSIAMQSDLNNCGFLINMLKSHFEPRQCGEFLGYLIDLVNGLLAVPQKKVDNLLCMLQSTKDRHLCIPARDVARVTGTIISMGLALGPVA